MGKNIPLGKDGGIIFLMPGMIFRQAISYRAPGNYERVNSSRHWCGIDAGITVITGFEVIIQGKCRYPLA